MARLGDAGLLDALQLGWRNSPVSAALLRAALPHLDGENAARRQCPAPAHSHRPLPTGRHRRRSPGQQGVYHLLSLIWRGPQAKRQAFHDALSQRNVETFFYIPTPSTASNASTPKAMKARVSSGTTNSSATASTTAGQPPQRRMALQLHPRNGL